MDTESFEQIPLEADKIGDGTKYLVDQIEVELVLHDDNPIAVDLPITVDLKITETGPSFKGDTAQGGTKPATLETGLTINVPLFVDTGETVKVDTRSGEYLSRV
jgi:elongation factor P